MRHTARTPSTRYTRASLVVHNVTWCETPWSRYAIDMPAPPSAQRAVGLGQVVKHESLAVQDAARGEQHAEQLHEGADRELDPPRHRDAEAGALA